MLRQAEPAHGSNHRLGIDRHALEIARLAELQKLERQLVELTRLSSLAHAGTLDIDELGELAEQRR